jgi:CubicO group peptidase (beta-lactamase class C family)
MRRAALAAIASLAVLALSPAKADDPKLQGPGTPAAAPGPLAADTPMATSAGATFTAPAGWTVSRRANVVVLDPPEGDSHLAIVDVEAADGDVAAAAAWNAYRGSARWPVQLATPQAARDGWAEVRVVDYETSPNDKATAFTVARRSAAGWTVAVVDATDATFEKRGAPFRLVLGSLRPKGYTRETFAGRKANRLDAARVAEIRAFLEKGMKDLDVPGLSFSLVQDGKVVHVGGLGVKEKGKPARVDADTLFIAASNTKALATLLLAKLADEGKLAWDQPVTELYPGFKLGDADTTRQVLVKHLVCACTGLPRQDLEWIFEYENQTPSTAMQVLGTMQPTSRFGEVFQYSNLMAAAAGYVGGAVAEPGTELGAAFDRTMRRKLLDPLGMKTSTFDFARAAKGNHATPHCPDLDGTTRPAPLALNWSIVPVRPAGGIWTSARELTRYVQMELANGMLPSAERLVSEKNLLERRKPQVAVAEDVTYGMGLFVSRAYGIPVVSHGGSLFGFKSQMFWLPDHGIGGVILTDADPGQFLLGTFIRKVVEVAFDGRPEADSQVAASAVQRRASLAKDRERLVVPPDAEASGRLAARYRNPSLGTVSVVRQGPDVVFDLGGWRTRVASRKNDDGTVSFITVDPCVRGFEFVVADAAGKRSLVVRDAQHEYVFSEEQ